MITYQEGKAIAEKHLHTAVNDIVIMEEYVIDLPYAWIFPHNHKVAIAGDIQYAVIGSAPIFVDKKDGRISEFPSAYDVPETIDLYEENNRSWRLTIDKDVYNDLKKMQSLRQVLGLSITQLTAFKNDQTTIIDNGATTRLNVLLTILKQHNISGEISLNAL